MNCLRVPQIMMPKEGTDLYKWSVIACDQYTSQPEYWKETEEIVGTAASALHLILPEVYLEEADETERVAEIHQTMEKYLADGTLQQQPRGFMLVERSFGKKYSRCGLVVEIDLEAYEYKKGAHSLVRPTEMTVEERIPPRLRVRQKAAVELPHIMLLIDDPDCTVIEPLMAAKNRYQQIYDTELMQKGGHISGWLIPEGEITDDIMLKIEQLAEPEIFRERYHLKEDYPLLNFAVGDGNHSMATAKAAWENIKKDLTEEEKKNHPARFCLCEVVNIQDKSLEIEPIHRVVFNVNEEELLCAAGKYYEEQGCRLIIADETQLEEAGGQAKPDVKGDVIHSFTLCSARGRKILKVLNSKWGIAVAALQSFLDDFLASHSESRIDYIHGMDVVEQLGMKEGNVGIFLPEVLKEDLFIGVIKDGVLPRKTFSMGEANEKRYYMECKKICK